MSSNYDLDPIASPPWWPGVAALALLAVIIIYIIFTY